MDYMPLRDPEAHAAYKRARYAAGLEQRTAAKQTVLRKRLLVLLGPRCSHCGIEDPRVLQLDHIEGGGNAERRERGKAGTFRAVLREIEDGLPSRLRVLCANCHLILGK